MDEAQRLYELGQEDSLNAIEAVRRFSNLSKGDALDVIAAISEDSAGDPARGRVTARGHVFGKWSA